MASKDRAELLKNISACSQLGNTIAEAAVVMGMSEVELSTLLSQDDEARERWAKGNVEALNQLRACLHKQAVAGSVQAAVASMKWREEAQAGSPQHNMQAGRPHHNKSGAAWKHKKIADVAAEVGVSASFVRNAINDEKNPLAYEKKAGEWQVKAGEVFDWAEKHAKRRPPNLSKPKGYDTELLDTRQPLPVPLLGFGIDDESAVLRILTSAYQSGGSGEEKRSDAQIAAQLRLYFDAKFKREKMLSLPDAIKGYRSLGEVYCHAIENGAAGKAADLLRIIREQLGVDLTRENSAALQIITAALCEQSNRIEIPAIREFVRQSVEGVELLELGGE